VNIWGTKLALKMVLLLGIRSCRCSPSSTAAPSDGDDFYVTAGAAASPLLSCDPIPSSSTSSIPRWWWTGTHSSWTALACLCRRLRRGATVPQPNLKTV
jgi:hypothetical protein